MKSPVALIILDGWGISPSKDGNAIYSAKTPNFNRYATDYPNVLVAASGLDVGLPEGQMGNSEVGHLNIGAGRVVYQELTRITKSIKDGDFFTNEKLVNAVKNAEEKGTKLHLMGLFSDGGVHSHLNHLKALLDLAKAEGLEEVYIHGFLDGRDTPPQSAITYVKEMNDYIEEVKIGKFASISGRYYSMDRDQRWERTSLSYDMLVKGEGEKATSALEAVEKSYADGKDDEFVLPTVITEDDQAVATISRDDSVIFFNFRPDRARQITRAIVDPEFTGFDREYFETNYVCLTMYDVTIPNVEVAYMPQNIDATLGEYLSSIGKKQLRIAETEKYAHVTFFFNGGVEEPSAGEDRELIPSPKVATYDLKPEMSAYEVTDRLMEKLDENKYDFIVLNLANPDMVGHTGNFEAAVKAVEVVDECLGKVVDKILSIKGKVLITADHGNAETMLNSETGKAMTAHTTNFVPCIIAGEGEVELREDGKLSDFAPTLLDLMDLDQPVAMTGETLIE